MPGAETSVILAQAGIQRQRYAKLGNDAQSVRSRLDALIYGGDSVSGISTST